MPKKNGTAKNELPDFVVSNFFGLNTAATNPDDLTPGTSQNALNWITGAVLKPGKANEYYGDHIEIRRGSIPLATSLLSAGGVSGLGVGVMANGNQVPFYSVGQHIYFYNSVTQAMAEVGSTLLPIAAANDDIAIIPYQNLADYSVFVSSPHSSFYKILTANPASPIDFQSYQARGFITTNLGRTFLWNNSPALGRPDTTDLYISWADGDLASQNPPFVPKENIAGKNTDGVTKTFSDTLVFDNAMENAFGIQIAAFLETPTTITGITAANPAVVTVSSIAGFSVGQIISIENVAGMTQINNVIDIITAIGMNTITLTNTNSTSYSAYISGGVIGVVENLVDDQNGNLISSNFGNTAGTVNYTTGAFMAIFQTAPPNGYTLSYSFFEDNSSNQGPADFTPFTPSGPAESLFQPQNGFGPLMNVFGLSGLFYCFHQYGVYQMQLINNSTFYSSADGTSAPTQQIYSTNVGMPYWRAGYATGDGVLYLDIYNFSYPTLRQLVLDYGQGSTAPLVIPESLSDAMNWTAFTFNKAAVQEWGDYYVVACQGSSNGIANPTNTTMFVMNKKTGYWDQTDFRASCMGIYYGALLAGDPISPNLQVLFSGFDDNGFNINNYWQSAPSPLGQLGTKSYNRFRVKGLIAPSQILQLSFSYDGSSYVTAATIAGDNSPYVNLGSPVEVGGPTIGSNIVGGGGTISAYPFEAELELPSSFFNRVSVQFEGMDVGYLSIEEYSFLDIRVHTRELPSPASQ